MRLVREHQSNTSRGPLGPICHRRCAALNTSSILFLLSVLWPQLASPQTVWFKYEGNPVMDVGRHGSWESAGVCIFRVLQRDSIYRAWYSGNDGMHRRMGYAISRDGIRWVKRPRPVLDLGPDGEWDWREVTKGYVLFSDSMYHMWYHGFDASVHRIGHAYSKDGIAWTKSRSVNPVLAPGPELWDEQSVGFPCVLTQAGGGYRMWYSGYRGADLQVQIGYATAPDPMSWKKYSVPVLPAGEPGSWDDHSLLFPNVLFLGGVYEMWYGGTRGVFSTCRTGHATSLDGIHWTKDPGNPGLTPGKPGSWDGQATYVGDVCFDGKLYRMWYGGFDGVTERTGFAVSPKGTQVRVSADRMYVRPGIDTILFSVRVADPSGLSFSVNIRSPDGHSVGVVSLYDDGLHGDSVAGDGLYANQWVPAGEKQYSVDVRLHLAGEESLGFTLDNAAEFTGVGPVQVAVVNLLGNKSPGPGDSVRMSIALRNQGSAASADSVSASVSTTDRWITGGPTEAESYGTIAHGESASIAGYYRFFISPNCPPGREIHFLVKIASAGVPLWQDTVILSVASPWWRTNWAYALYGFSAVALFYGIRRVETERIRRKHRREMEQFQAEQVRKLDQLKSRFFANISHEFRTPLTLIRGPVEQMLSGKYKGDVKSQYEMILRNSARLERLVNQLLDLSKLESGQMKLHAEELDIAQFISGVAAAFESLAKRKGIEFRIDCPGESIIGWFDRDALEKIVTNLLSNAFKFTAEGGEVRLRISLSSNLPVPARSEGEIWRGDESVEVTVSDTGIGIPAAQIDKVFDRFYQVDQSQTREYGGTGIGLALTKELVDMHKGEIAVASEVGRGTSFTVRLPLGKDYFSEQGTTEPPLPFTQGQTPATSDLTSSPVVPAGPEPDDSLPLLLIIEDNADMRRYIRAHLDGRYRIGEAVNGEEGVEKAIEAIPDLIISDVMMPRMDGIEMCKKLKTDERTSHIPIILLTAKAGTNDKIEGLETGADDYLVKPFDPKELGVRIRNLIDQRLRLQKKFGRLTTIRPSDIAATSLDEQFLRRAMDIAEAHIADRNFSAEIFAQEMFLSRMQLHRKIKALTGHSPWELFRIMRLERAG